MSEQVDAAITGAQTGAETCGEEKVASAKNIVICSDGTGNRGGKTRGTNVWRIFNAIDRHNVRQTEQVTYYDDGVGTQDWHWLKLFSGAFGFGLSRNIRDAYAFLAMNYNPGDRIYLFGFSRGAFTVRSLAGLINFCGLINREAVVSATRQRLRMLKQILKAYRSTDENKKAEALGKVRKVVANNDTYFHEGPIPIHFIGVWDTVDAIGLPFDRVMQGLDIVWNWLFRRRLWDFRDRQLGPHVRYAYQALALDDERKTFHPILWKHPNNTPEAQDAADHTANSKARDPDERIIEQVWFAGAHANVGGGYPKDAMSLVTLDWMMGKAEECGLRFVNGARENIQRDADVHGRIYDSRSGWGAAYRLAPRNPYELYERKGKKREFLPTIHGSVFQRIQRGTDFYAPKVIRGTEDGELIGAVTWTNSGPYAKPQNGDETINA